MPGPRHSSFEYPPLIPVQRSIRLLDLSGRITHNNTAIIGSLKSFDLSSCPPYRALSYTWGSPFPKDGEPSEIGNWCTPTQVLNCNGTLVYIRQNLHDALQSLIQRGMAGIYWIDSICINQQDDQERGAQVSMMGDIFAGAVEVICWLGRGDAHCDNFLELHRRLPPLITEHGLDELNTISPADIDAICGFQNAESHTSRIAGFTTTEKLCESYMKFLQRTWFERLWIAQEVALAKNLKLLFGQYEVDWDDMCRVAFHAGESCYNPLWVPYHRYISSGTSLPVAAVGMFWQLREDQRSEALRTNLAKTVHYISKEEGNYVLLLETLRETAGLHSTDLRDRIYGIIGIVSKMLPNGQIPLLQVDYHITTSVLFTRTASILTTGLPYLSLLGAGTPDRPTYTESLPSWVPDFASERFLKHNISRKAHEAGIRPFCRSLREITANRLVLYGHLLGTINSICGGHDIPSGLPFLATVDKVSALQPNLVATYCRTIVCSEENIGPNLSERTRSQFHAYVLDWMPDLEPQKLPVFVSSLQHLRETGYGYELPPQQDIENWSDAEMLKQLSWTERKEVYRLSNTFHGERIEMACAFTDCGIFVGSVMDMLKGDQVWIIEDAKSPIVLRPVPNSNQFTLVGEAYVDGVMFGEALRAEGCAQRAVQVTIV